MVDEEVPKKIISKKIITIASLCAAVLIIAIIFVMVFILPKKIGSPSLKSANESRNLETQENIPAEEARLTTDINPSCPLKYRGSFEPNDFYLKQYATRLPFNLYAANNKDFCWMGTSYSKLRLSNENEYTFTINGVVPMGEKYIDFSTMETRKGIFGTSKDEIIKNFPWEFLDELDYDAIIDESEINIGSGKAKFISIYAGNEKLKEYQDLYNDEKYKEDIEDTDVPKYFGIVIWSPDEKTDAIVAAGDFYKGFPNREKREEEPKFVPPKVDQPYINQKMADYKSVGIKLAESLNPVSPNDPAAAQNLCENSGGNWGLNDRYDLFMRDCSYKQPIPYDLTSLQKGTKEIDCLCPITQCYDRFGTGKCVNYNSPFDLPGREKDCSSGGGKLAINLKYYLSDGPEKLDYQTEKYSDNDPRYFCRCPDGAVHEEKFVGHVKYEKCKSFQDIKTTCEGSGGIWLDQKLRDEFFKKYELNYDGEYYDGKYSKAIYKADRTDYDLNTTFCGDMNNASFSNQVVDEFCSATDYKAEMGSPNFKCRRQAFYCYCKKNQCIDWETGACKNIQ